MTWPSMTAAPSAATHSDKVPSTIDISSFGIVKVIGIKVISSLVGLHGGADAGGDRAGVRHLVHLDVAGIGDRREIGAEPDRRPLQDREQLLVDRAGELGAE